MSHLYDEIHQQPEIIRTLLQEQASNVAVIATAIRDFEPQFIMIAARGTSDNAARYAQYLMSIQAALPVALATPSVHTLYDASPMLGKSLVIGISQSGQSDDVRKVLEDAKPQGALTISITNDPNSPLANVAHFHIDMMAGAEQSVAATKSYTTELTTLAMLVQAITNDNARQASLLKLPDYVATTLEHCANIGDWAQRYRYMERLAVIGRGYNYCTAFEISLKIKELCYVTSEQYSEADFRHGPIAIISQGFPVLAIAPSGKTLPKMLDLLDMLNEKEAECLVISDDETALSKGINPMRLPVGIPEWLSPICAVIPGQLFGFHLAQAKGLNIDNPRGLNKVTVTQ